MPPEARLAQRTQKVSQSLEPKEIQTLVRNLKLSLLLGVSELSADAGLPGGNVRLRNGDVVFLLDSLDELLNDFVQLAFGLHLLHLLAHLLVEQLAFRPCLLEH